MAEVSSSLSSVNGVAEVIHEINPLPSPESEVIETSEDDSSPDLLFQPQEKTQDIEV
jgi:hypothetical protein